MYKQLCIGLLMLPLLSVAATEQQKEDKETVYRWLADDGTVVFSESPPPAGVDAKKIKLRDADVVIEQDRRKLQQLRNQSRSIDRHIDSRRQQREQLQEKIAAAEKALVQARRAQQEGKAPMPGERLRTATGVNRLLPSYFERQESLAEDVENLERQIEELNRQLNQLH